jgi:hypothetical protein
MFLNILAYAGVEAHKSTHLRLSSFFFIDILKIAPEEEIRPRWQRRPQLVCFCRTFKERAPLYSEADSKNLFREC